MSLSSKFGYTNVTDLSSATITPVALDVPKSYALITDEPTECVLVNTTCPIDQGELLSYKCQAVKHISTTQENLYPPAVRSGVQYVVKLEVLLSNTSESDPTFRVDIPIVMYLTVRHPKSGLVTEAMIAELFKRLAGACIKADGTWRFGDLMRSALKPVE